MTTGLPNYANNAGVLCFIFLEKKVWVNLIGHGEKTYHTVLSIDPRYLLKFFQAISPDVGFIHMIKTSEDMITNFRIM